ncbi:MAG: proprotein convertase P-domain-containing protein [Phycisphaerales bacterium]|nr:MAG: proprotein convertase P-domain-containing protein [Phycisphaerales bacterium]
MWRKLILLISFVVALGGTAQAALYVWNGSAGDGLWETPGNWTVTDSAWTWPNEEAVAANAIDPNASIKWTNADTIAIDIIGATVTRTGALAIQGEPDGSTTAVLTLDGTSLTMDARLATSTDDGNAGRGEINILNGSTVTITGDGTDLTIADDNGNWGLLNVVDSTIIIPDDFRTDDGEAHVNIGGSSRIETGDDFLIGNSDAGLSFVDIGGTAVIAPGDDFRTNRGENHVTIGGDAAIPCDDFSISGNASGVSFLDISGNAVITIVDDFDLDNGQSTTTVGGNAVITFGDDGYVPDDDDSVANLTITDNAVFNIGDDITVADNAGSLGHMIITGNATVNAPDEFYLTDNPTGFATLDVNGTATLNVGDDLDVGEDGPAVCNIGGNAVVTVGDTIYIPHHQQGIEASMTISGNATVSADDIQVVNDGGNTGFLHISGNPTITMREFLMNNDAGDPGTSEVIMDGGTVTVSGNSTINDDNNGTATFTLNDGSFYTGGYLNVSDNLDGTAHLTINGGKMITGDRLRLGKDGGDDTGQVRIFLNGGLLQAEELSDIKIADTQIILTGGALKIGSASVSVDDMLQLIDDGTIVVDVNDYIVAPDGAYTRLSAPPVVAWNASPADGITGMSATPVISTYVSPDVPKAVPDRGFILPGTTVLGEAVSTVSVPDSVTITDLNVELDITMPGNNADLNVYLKSPGGKQVKLFDDVGLRQSHFTNTVLDDEASTSIKDGSEPYTGLFKPEGKLRDFDGRNAEGTWQLKIIDDWYGNTATLNAWQLVVESNIVLSWNPGVNAASQDVYFSDNIDDVSDRAGSALLGSVAGDAGSIAGEALDVGTTYYWCVDALDPNDSVVGPGEIWSFATVPGAPKADISIASSSDDAEEDVGGSAAFEIDLTSSDLEFMYDNDPADPKDEQVVGLRFVDVTIPAGTTIASAYVQFDADDINNDRHVGDVHVLIQGELNPDPVTFEDTPNNITGRPKTTAVVEWDPAQWMETHLQSPDEATSDISSIIQEIVDQDDWAEGNALVLIFSNNPATPSTGIREAESLDGSAAPVLHIQGEVVEAASQPSPADEAVDVPQDTIVSWEPGTSAVARQVYFGTEDPPPPVGMGITTGISYDPGELEVSTTYYLRVDEIEADGTTHEGNVWSFTTVIGEATAPDPADGATDVAADAILGWTAGVNAVSHDVFLGTTDPPEFIGNQAETSFDPGGLGLTSTYYWQIDEIDADGTRHVGDVWSFSTLSGQASQPDPVDGAVVEQRSALLSWTAGLSAASHDVYISEDVNDVTGGAEAAFAGNLTETSMSADSLVPGTTYYWRVDAVEADPNVVHAGDVWSFSVLTDKANSPDPADGAIDVAADAQLSWAPGLEALLHYVYFGDDLDTVTNATGALPLPLLTYNPGPLEPGKTYYWRIDEFSPSGTITGDVWSFTTAP